VAWWGKALGGAFGFMIGGPLGALMGIAFGHSFDRGMSGVGGAEFAADQERIQAAFFTATFSVMGYIAKADGRVTRDEIRLAEAVMERLGLGTEMRESAKKLFGEGKANDFPIDEVMQQFKRETHRRTTLIQMFLEIQLQAAYATRSTRGNAARRLRSQRSRCREQQDFSRRRLPYPRCR
jgi:DnaJ like chaperone protein